MRCMAILLLLLWFPDLGGPLNYLVCWISTHRNFFRNTWSKKKLPKFNFPTIFDIVTDWLEDVTMIFFIFVKIFNKAGSLHRRTHSANFPGKTAGLFILHLEISTYLLELGSVGWLPSGAFKIKYKPRLDACTLTVNIHGVKLKNNVWNNIATYNYYLRDRP